MDEMDTPSDRMLKWRKDGVWLVTDEHAEYVREKQRSRFGINGILQLDEYSKRFPPCPVKPPRPGN